MSPGNDLERPIPALVRELDAVRKRLDQAQEWLRDAETSVTAAALAMRTKHLCRQASQCDDPSEMPEFLRQARETLRDLERVLGLH